MKAIETRYNGYLFRSRLEARWAVWFDALGVKWEYEPEGFDLGPAGLYLPDFWLPQLQCWFEVKGQLPNEREQQVAAALAKLTEHWVDIVYGPVGDQRVIGFRHTTGQQAHVCEIGLCYDCGMPAFGRVLHNDVFYFLGHCYACHGHVMAINRSEYLEIQADPRLLGAYRIARSARFEHGDEERTLDEIAFFRSVGDLAI